MKKLNRVLPIFIIFPATTALCMDQMPTFTPGEWEITTQQEAGATYKDSNSKREGGFSSIKEDKPKQVIKMCVTKDHAKLSPQLFAPKCQFSNAVYSEKEMKADLNCSNPSMPMQGNIRMTILNGGKEISGFQFLSGGGKQVGAMMMTNIRMKYLDECSDKK
ncbi:hypothetical protein LPB140_08845 [Sphingorhabdus lutea]|uniref:DUF3617 family protein n=1 Tax=Sphingorhabdus lutea TaxID=1913578 RepID=A0A1L3JCM2_9SPHN|nr:DUF3617 family protein [Sphingorhabdus lutea]APG62878.1 hypothetical protein LPB140_08845 [Sphingorhabdus lutea]